MPRDLIIDLRVGGGSVPEIAQGIVRIWGTEVRPNAASLVLTTETTLKLTGGKATLANAQTSGTGPLYEWAYIIQVEPFHGRNFRFYVAIPDGTSPVNLKDLPKLDPNTGEGFYVSIEEWEALYGDLPDRVDALETSQGSQDTKITNLEARPSGNATVRFSTTAGKAIYLTEPGTAVEHLVYGDTGWRDIKTLIPEYVSGIIKVRREMHTVTISAENLVLTGAASGVNYSLPLGSFALSENQVYLPFGGYQNGSAHTIVAAWSGASQLRLKDSLPVGGMVSFAVRGAWPTTLPGTAIGTIPNL